MHKAIRLIHGLSPWFILIWAVTAGVAVAATLYVTGGDSLFGTDIAIDFLGDPGESAGPSFFERVGGLGFSIACGGLVLVNMVLAHRLLTRIGANVRGFSSTQAKAKTARENIETIRACDEAATAVLAGCSTALARLGTPDTCAGIVTNDILSTIARERATYETWLFDITARKARSSQSRFSGIRDDLKPEEVRKRVDALRAITFEDIDPHVCGEARKAAKPISTVGAHNETVH